MNPYWRTIARATEQEYWTFREGLADSATAQANALQRILAANADSAWGREFGFASIRTPDRYRGSVPLTTYADLEPDIQRQLAGENRLFSEELLHVEETSGTGATSKLVPYSASSIQSFRSAAHAWLHDLANHYPSLGPAYFAISPVSRAPRTLDVGIRIGAASDLIYFGEALHEPLAAIGLVPDGVAMLQEIERWRLVTLLYLLHSEELTLLSSWSPTFLTTLLDALPEHAEELLRLLHEGFESLLPDAASKPPAPGRARMLAKAMAGKQLDTASLWPDLQLLSCWTHASAGRQIAGLRELFPQADIQGKGLLSTEGVVTIPLCGLEYPVLALDSGFYEFLDSSDETHLAHEVREGSEYEVIMTVPGFYRYRTGDQVIVRGKVGNTPMLEFTGRCGLVSDLVGEKLGEPFVADCLATIQGFAMLAPALEPRPHYRLYADRQQHISAAAIDEKLRCNPQYDYARKLGQLDLLEIIPVDRPMERYMAWALQNGQRLGDIKPPSLRPEHGWDARLGLC